MVLTTLRGQQRKEEGRGRGEEREEEEGSGRGGRGKSLCAGLPSPTTIPKSNNQLCK